MLDGFPSSQRPRKLAAMVMFDRWCLRIPPEILARVLLPCFSFIFLVGVHHMHPPLIRRCFPADVGRLPLFPNAIMAGRHGQNWPLASKNCRPRSPAWFFLKFFGRCAAYGHLSDLPTSHGRCSLASPPTRGRDERPPWSGIGGCRRCAQNSLIFPRSRVGIVDVTTRR